MTDKEYRQHSAISRSDLFKISESPEKFKFYKENPQEPTPALIFGQLFHKMVLQPETLSDDFIVTPNINRRTKEGKQEFEKFTEQAKNKTIVSEEMYKQAKAMSEVLFSNNFTKKLLSGEKEVPYFWTDEITGEQCKCRVDCITNINGLSLIVDLKTANDASTDIFMREAIKYGYDLQSSMYIQGVNANTNQKYNFVFIVIEKSPPYSINILQADELFVKHGNMIFRDLISIYHQCKTTGNWWGYLGKNNSINNLSLPTWLAKEIE